MKARKQGANLKCGSVSGGWPDGLVANLAKYLSGQPVIGVTPDPDRTEGVLTPLLAETLPALLPRAAAGDMDLRRLSMVEAILDDQQRLAALNELFIGHCSHQSARYDLSFEGRTESQSSSGVIVSTGTGLTGWARSIMAATHRRADFEPDERRAVYFAREPWPSRTTGSELAFGEINPRKDLDLTSRMNDGGVIFADGIEQDFLRFDWGVKVRVGISERTLNLVSAQKEQRTRCGRRFPKLRYPLWGRKRKGGFLAQNGESGHRCAEEVRRQH